MFVYAWEVKGGLKESLHPLTHQPHFFKFFFFWAQFFKTCLFLCLVSPEPFLNKAGRLVEKKKSKACGDGEASLCRLNGVIVRHGGGEENGSRGTEGV